MSIHGTIPVVESAVNDWYISFQTKIIENLPRRIPKEIGLEWKNRGDLMKQVLDEALMSKRILRRLLFDARRFTVTMASNKTTEEILATGHYNQWPRAVCSENFPVRPMAQGVANIEILKFKRVIGSKEALQIAQEYGLKRPFYEHLFFLGEQHPEAVFMGNRIMFLHEPWEDPNEKTPHLKKQILSLRKPDFCLANTLAKDLIIDYEFIDGIYGASSDRFAFVCGDDE